MVKSMRRFRLMAMRAAHFPTLPAAGRSTTPMNIWDSLKLEVETEEEVEIR